MWHKSQPALKSSRPSETSRLKTPLTNHDKDPSEGSLACFFPVFWAQGQGLTQAPQSALVFLAPSNLGQRTTAAKAPLSHGTNAPLGDHRIQSLGIRLDMACVKNAHLWHHTCWKALLKPLPARWVLIVLQGTQYPAFICQRVASRAQSRDISSGTETHASPRMPTFQSTCTIVTLLADRGRISGDSILLCEKIAHAQVEAN